MGRVHCTGCDADVVVDPSGLCPEGHRTGRRGERVEATIAVGLPHPDEPEPWVAQVVIDELDDEPERSIRPPSLRDVAAPAANTDGAVGAGAGSGIGAGAGTGNGAGHGTDVGIGAGRPTVARLDDDGAAGFLEELHSLASEPSEAPSSEPSEAPSSEPSEAPSSPPPHHDEAVAGNAAGGDDAPDASFTEALRELAALETTDDAGPAPADDHPEGREEDTPTAAPSRSDDAPPLSVGDASHLDLLAELSARRPPSPAPPTAGPPPSGSGSAGSDGQPAAGDPPAPPPASTSREQGYASDERADPSTGGFTAHGRPVRDGARRRRRS